MATQKDKRLNERPAAERMFVVEPQSMHTHTFILLHGLGSNGEKFGTELLETGVTSAGRRLADLIPGARWVFPTSKRRRSTAFGRSMLTQWFDMSNLQKPEYQRDKQLQGLEESGREILEILESEMKRVAPERIMLGGLSQGCAMSLAVLLCLEYGLGGCFGMSGYKTFQKDLEEAITDEDRTSDDADDPFAPSTDDDDDDDDDTVTQPTDPSVRAQTFERDLLCLEPLPNPSSEQTAARQTPVFLGHGTADKKVPVALGRAAAEVMRRAGYDVTWKGYEGAGHWYKVPDEIDDVVAFVRGRVGWELME